MPKRSKSRGSVGSAVYVVRQHCEYDRESESSAQAVFTSEMDAQRYAINRIAMEKVDNDGTRLFSETLASKMGLSDLSVNVLDEAEEYESVGECLLGVVSPEEISIIFSDALQSQKDNHGAVNKYFIDTVTLDIEVRL